MRELSIITPLTLLLFGCKSAEYKTGEIFVDKWTHFKSSPQDIAKILALHSPIKDLLNQVSDNPRILSRLRSGQYRLVGLIKNICRTNVFKIHWLEKDCQTPVAKIEEPPSKMMKLNKDVDSGNFIVDRANKFCFMEMKPVRFQAEKNLETGKEQPLGLAERNKSTSLSTGLKSQKGNINDHIGKQSESYKFLKNFRNELIAKNAMYKGDQKDKVNTLNINKKSFRHQNVNMSKKNKDFGLKIENALTLEVRDLQALTLFSTYLSELETVENKNKNEVIQEEISGQIENFNKTAMEEAENDDLISKNSAGHSRTLGSSVDFPNASLKNKEEDDFKVEFCGQIERLGKSAIKPNKCNVISKDSVGNPDTLGSIEDNLSKNFENVKKFSHKTESLNKNTSRTPVRFTFAKSSVPRLLVNQSFDTSEQDGDCSEVNESNVDLCNALSSSEETVISSNQETGETQKRILSTLIESLNKKGELAKFYENISKSLVVNLPSTSDKSVNLTNLVGDFRTSTTGEIGLSHQSTTTVGNFENQITMPSNMKGHDDTDIGHGDEIDYYSGNSERSGTLFMNQENIHGNPEVDQSIRRKSHVGYETGYSTLDNNFGACLQYTVQESQNKEYTLRDKIHVPGLDLKRLEGKELNKKGGFCDKDDRNISNKKRKFDSTSNKFDSHREEERSGNRDKGYTKQKRFFSSEGDAYGGQATSQDFGAGNDHYKIPVVVKRFGLKKNSHKNLEKDYSLQSEGYSIQKEVSFEDQVSRFVNQVRGVTDIRGQLKRNYYESERTDIQLGRQVDGQVHWNQGVHSYEANVRSQSDHAGSAGSSSNYEYFSSERDVRKQRNVDNSSKTYFDIQKGNYWPSTSQLNNTENKEYFGFNKVSSCSKSYQSHNK